MKLYYFLGWLLSPFAWIAFHVYGRLTGTARARVVVQNEEEEILLVQSWLSRGKWGMPGGGIGRGEPAQEAALRELREETGIEVKAAELSPLFTLRSTSHNEVVFSLSVPKGSLPDQLPNRFEIQDAAWFSLEDLPKLESSAHKILAKVASRR